MKHSFLPRASGPFPFFVSRGGLLTGLLCVAMLLLFASAAHAQSSQNINVYQQGNTNTDAVQQGASDFLIMLYKILKVVAVVIGCIGVWRLVEHDYKWGVSFVVACAALFLMPVIVSSLESLGSNAMDSQQQTTTGP